MWAHEARMINCKRPRLSVARTWRKKSPRSSRVGRSPVCRLQQAASGRAGELASKLGAKPPHSAGDTAPSCRLRAEQTSARACARSLRNKLRAGFCANCASSVATRWRFWCDCLAAYPNIRPPRLATSSARLNQHATARERARKSTKVTTNWPPSDLSRPVDIHHDTGPATDDTNTRWPVA